jgi:hypothetical protein
LEQAITSGSSPAQAHSINDSWQVVGHTGATVFVFENGALHDLQTLLDSTGSGWVLEDAIGIANNGMIAAVGHQTSAPTVQHALLLTPSASLSPDTTPPTGSVSVNSGAATTSTPIVSVAAPGSDASGIFAVRLSNAATVGANGELTLGKSYVPASTISWSVTATTAGGTLVDGTKTAYAQWEDWRGNWSAPMSASITLSRPLAIISAGLSPSSFARGSHTTFTWETTKPASDTVEIKNKKGTIIRSWALGTLSSAPHSLVWSGKLANGTQEPLGTYWMRLVAKNGATVTGGWHAVKIT